MFTMLLTKQYKIFNNKYGQMSWQKEVANLKNLPNLSGFKAVPYFVSALLDMYKIW